jgi:hypothetical protein
MEKVVLVDDLDGSDKDVETVRLGVDGGHYEIDLNRGNANELRTMLAPYLAVARPSRPYTVKPKDRTPASSQPRKPSRKADRGNGVPAPSAVREWAKARGIDVNPTGRIPKSLMADYMADQS